MVVTLTWLEVGDSGVRYSDIHPFCGFVANMMCEQTSGASSCRCIGLVGVGRAWDERYWCRRGNGRSVAGGDDGRADYEYCREYRG